MKPACPGTQPSDSTCLAEKGWFTKKEKIKFAKRCSGPLCLTDFCLFPCQGLVASGKGSRAGGRGLSNHPPQFGEEIPTIRQDNSAGLFFGELLPSHQDYGPGPPNTLSLWLLCCQRHVETLVS